MNQVQDSIEKLFYFISPKGKKKGDSFRYKWDFVGNILIVLKRLRLSWCPDFIINDKLFETISIYQEAQLSNLRLLKTQGNYFFLNLDLLTQKLQEKDTTHFFENKCFIDIKASLKTPTLIEDLAISPLKKTLESYVKILQFSKKKFENQFYLNLDSFENLSSFILYPPTFFGILLDYPFIYTNSNSLNNTNLQDINFENDFKNEKILNEEDIFFYQNEELQGNCLSMIPLFIFTLSIKFNIHQIEFKIPLFSVPQIIFKDHSNIYSLWKHNLLNKKIENLEIEIITETRTEFSIFF